MYKYLIGYMDDGYKIKTFQIILTKSGYVKSYHGKLKCIYFLIKDDELLKECIDICNKVSNNIKKEFDSKSVCNKILLKTKVKSYGDQATDFYDKEMPKVDSNYICLAVILIGFVLKKYENYRPNIFLR